MEYISFLWETVLPFLVVLTILVFVHELGHYWVARRCNVRVEVFSVGFGPEIKGWTDKNNTRWKLSAIPLGGYVKMFGESETITEDGEEREMTPEETAVSFHHKSLAQRAAVVFAGPGINFLFAIVVFAGLFSIVGQPTIPSVIGTVTENSAAEQAGFKTGDRIVSVNGKAISLFSELQQEVVPSANVALAMVVLRDGRELAVTVTPKSHKQVSSTGESREIGRMGVTQNPESVTYIRQNPAVSIWLGIERSYAVTAQILTNVGEMITGKRSAEELGGPIRIAQISGQVAENGIVSFIGFIAILSVNLGLINLFPIPMLDGGHLVFYAIEAVRGKPLGERAQEYGFRIGLACVLALFVFVTWNDLVQLKFFEFITGLFT